jgi:hypothetical protein
MECYSTEKTFLYRVVATGQMYVQLKNVYS